MDPTNSTAETSNITTMEMNGHDNANENMEGSTNLSATTQNHNSYDDLFPQLPGKNMNAGNGTPLASTWGKQPKMIIPPTVTQVSCFNINPPKAFTPMMRTLESLY